MQTGEYIAQRILPEYIRLACARQDISCTAFSDDWILRLQKGSKIAWICGYKTDLNRSAASQIAQDKVATYEVLTAAGFPAVRHALVRPVQTAPIDKLSLQTQFPGRVVIKPLQGTSGRGVRLFDDVITAIQHAERSDEPAWAVAPYLDIVMETRVLVLDQVVLLAYEKHQPKTTHGLAFYNLSHGAQAVTIGDTELSETMRTVALGACKSLGLRLVAVDIVTLKDGSQSVLEVNDGFSMEHYTLQSDENRTRAIACYDTIVATMFAGV